MAARYEAAAAVVPAAVVSVPWVPREQIHTTTRTLDGYVLQTTSSFLKVLSTGPARLVIVKSANVITRRFDEPVPGQ